MNHLDPNLKKHPWTHDEDLQLLEAQRRLGNSWTKIALEIDGRGYEEEGMMMLMMLEI
jgi:myb proto-oncogene protein